MNKILKIAGLSLIFCILFQYSICAQQVLKELSAEDGVKINYKWKPIKKSKNKVLELCFEVTNTNDYPVEAIFSFKIIRNKEEKSNSGDIKKCLKPKKTLRGRKKGLNFLIEEVTLTDISSDKFELLLADMEVKKVNKCKK